MTRHVAEATLVPERADALLYLEDLAVGQR